MIFQSAKGLAFLSAALMIGSWLVTRIFQNDYQAPQIRVGPAIVVFSLGFIAVIFSFLARVGDDIDLLLYYLSSYSSGHLFAFLDWFSDRYFHASRFSGYAQPQIQAGFYTFMGIFKALGDLREVPLGIYDEFYEIPGVLTTNIYTVFRGLISDFGIFGSLFFGLVAGFMANAIFFVMLWNRFSVIAIIAFVYMVGLIYQSYVVSSLTWISIPASALISMLLLLLIKRSTLSQIERHNCLTVGKAAA
jgi:oligosaccharide repeat unit polymerase